MLAMMENDENGTHLAKSHDKHNARDECDTGSQGGEQGENHQNITNVHISNVDELIADDVVTVVSAAWCSHWVTVEVKDSSYDREDGDELKSIKHLDDSPTASLICWHLQLKSPPWG